MNTPGRDEPFVPPQRAVKAARGMPKRAMTQAHADTLKADAEVWQRIVDIVEANSDYPWPPAMDPKRLAEIIGVGRRPPTALDLALIADHYRVTPAWLLTGDDRGLDDGVITELQSYICWLRDRAKRAEDELATRVQTIHQVWQIVGELRQAALADGRGLYGDPLAQRLSAALTGVNYPPSKTEAANKEKK